MPQCQECKIECNSLVYHAYNSYGHGFSHGALKWLTRKNSAWTKAHMRSNFLTLNVFFRDMAHTEYRQVQATSLTEILSDIGGNMGMFLGMSLITVTEISLFMSKIGWIAFSKKRRDYLYNKKKREQIELKIDLRDVKKQMDRGLPISIKRRGRSSTAPPAPRTVRIPPWRAKLSTCVPFYTTNSSDLRVGGNIL
ncbi:hypothetical protein NECAME_11710 [Necator americanus]|uniref:Amiloride-sensitive sodium channel n=1 Tax=Necator americanus TaxID=51031 RepID=W2T4B4_NECAM|nr:hypothetical protein NECAME_11710 [Necator americanus]ETN76404.1 hypothetical protein NECAME_11710 [Necator americanus]